MPTVTNISQFAITNVGPLTTVFTPPAACATAAPELALALSDVAFGEEERHAVYWRQSCDPVKHGECYPSGAGIDSAVASAESKGYSEIATMRYFSPASACPDRWTTAGLATKAANGSVSSSGVFVPPVIATYEENWLIGYNPPLNVMMEILEPEEEAVICCPQSYTPGINGDCYSTVPESVYGEKTACIRFVNNDDITMVTRTMTYNDTTVTGAVWSITVSSRRFEPTTQTLEPELATSIYPVAFVPGVTLVNGPARQTDASGTGTGSGSSPTETPSAAHRVRASGGGVGLVAAVWGIAALSGIAVALPL
ncbi:hypothetical protein CPLU01_12159 [Colletotrichum plurivorum]|uniref:Uncharacterized protein n=1 Tax=Colletotrichum plurivorum TaxID=2175906 RepID=A0A8H6JZ91_9PEZI|nr:hypothetical protein CPLU01_12159 [Colletotrichum plurivorum]